MRYGDAIEHDYSEVQHLRRQLARAELLAEQVQAQLKDREKTILLLQRKLRAKVFTQLADLTPNDLAVPDDMFPEADASGLYTLNRHQLVHMLLKKEAVIRGLVRRVWATKLERDQWMLRTYQAQRAGGIAAGDAHGIAGSKVRGFYSEVQQWAFADRSKVGIERVEARMDRAVRRQRHGPPQVTPREYSMKKRVDNWTRDPVDLGPLVDFGGNGYYGRRPESGTVRDMMDEEQNSVLWNVSDDEDTDIGSKGKSHTMTPDPFAQGANRNAGEDEWCARKYVCTALASIDKGVEKAAVVGDDSRAGFGVGLTLKQAPMTKRASELVEEVDPCFWLPDGATSLTTLSIAESQPERLQRTLDGQQQIHVHMHGTASSADSRVDPSRNLKAETARIDVGLRRRRKVSEEQVCDWHERGGI